MVISRHKAGDFDWMGDGALFKNMFAHRRAPDAARLHPARFGGTGEPA